MKLASRGDFISPQSHSDSGASALMYHVISLAMEGNLEISEPTKMNPEEGCDLASFEGMVQGQNPDFLPPTFRYNYLCFAGTCVYLTRQP